MASMEKILVRNKGRWLIEGTEYWCDASLDFWLLVHDILEHTEEHTGQYEHEYEAYGAMFRTRVLCFHMYDYDSWTTDINRFFINQARAGLDVRPPDKVYPVHMPIRKYILSLIKGKIPKENDSYYNNILDQTDRELLVAWIRRNKWAIIQRMSKGFFEAEARYGRLPMWKDKSNKKFFKERYGNDPGWRMCKDFLYGNETIFEKTLKYFRQISYFTDGRYRFRLSKGGCSLVKLSEVKV